MTQSFGSLASFAGFLTGVVVKMEEQKHHALEEAAQILEHEAKSYPGEYQPGWPALQPETVGRKATGDSPLLETGAMRASYEHTVGHDEAVVGSNDDKAVWHEVGTSKMPPRPVLGLAAATK